MKIIHNDRGETLIEVLASIVIASLSVALMFGCIMVSAQMDKDARAMDEEYYLGLTAADTQVDASTPDAPENPDDSGDPDAPGDSDSWIVTIKRKNSDETGNPDETEDPEESGDSVILDITIYGDAGMYSYRRAAE